MPPLAPRSRRRGVTLVEIVIAIFVLTVGVLSIISLFPAGYRLTKGAFNRSVAALAARDALARILAEQDDVDFPLPDETSEPLYGVDDSERVGTVRSVSSSSITCWVKGNETPSWPSLAGYYVVFTSGSASGTLCEITSGSGSSLTCGDLPNGFRTATSERGVPVRVGDHFAIIGSKSQSSACFPTGATTSVVYGRTVNHTRFVADSGAYRTIEVANEGAPDNVPWNYSYGCIVSAPSKSMKWVHRVDVFTYRGFSPNAELDDQNRPVGHHVTYVSNLADYSHALDED